MGIAHRPGLGFFVLRVALGSVFLAHGWTKLFGNGISFVQEMLRISGWSLPDGILWVVALVEILAGLALLAGFFARTAAILLAGEMAVAVLMFHLREGFFIVAIPDAPLAYGFEFHVALVAGLLAVALGGPGRWATEQWAGRSGGG